MNDKTQGWRLPAIATALAVAACNGAQNPEPEAVAKAAVSIDQGRWNIASINGNAPVSGVDSWLEIDLAGGSVTGNAGCNNFFASFEGELDNLQMGPVGGTKKMCPGDPMAQEAAVYEILGGATAMRVSAAGELVVESSGGQLTAKPAKKG
ncbi:MAG: META domain-containing protein [Lysobacterales bacterium]